MKANFNKFFLVILCFTIFGEGIASGFSSHGANFSRAFDITEVQSNQPITVTINFSHAEPYDMRGFYFTEHLPVGLQVDPVSVSIGDRPFVAYTFESGFSGEVFAGNIPYRWILEFPPDFEAENPIPSGSNVQIVYTITSQFRGYYSLYESSWAGYFPDAPGGEAAAFGHSESDDWQTVFFCFIGLLF